MNVIGCQCYFGQSNNYKTIVWPWLSLVPDSDVKTDFFSQPIIDLLKPFFLPIIEMSLLFETTDERRTGQAYAKSHVGSNRFWISETDYRLIKRLSVNRLSFHITSTWWAFLRPAVHRQECLQLEDCTGSGNPAGPAGSLQRLVHGDWGTRGVGVGAKVKVTRKPYGRTAICGWANDTRSFALACAGLMPVACPALQCHQRTPYQN